MDITGLGQGALIHIAGLVSVGALALWAGAGIIRTVLRGDQPAGAPPDIDWADLD